MRYQIFGTDLTQRPYLRFISDEDIEQKDAEGVMNYIDKFYHIKKDYDKARKDSSIAFPGSGEGIEVELLLAKDKHGSYSLFMKKKAALKRIGLLIPEIHPIFNIKMLMESIYNNYIDSLPRLTYAIRSINNTGYIVNSIQDYV
jgi:hypothetical protein